MQINFPMYSAWDGPLLERIFLKASPGIVKVKAGTQACLTFLSTILVRPGGVTCKHTLIRMGPKVICFA